MNRTQKGEGFQGQRIVVLPRAVLGQAAEHPLLQGLLPTDAGYFPEAQGHLRERPDGVDQAIFIYCVKGAGWCEMAGHRFGVAASELLVIPPKTAHAYGADETRPWTMHWFHAQGTHVSTFLSELGITTERPVCYLGEDGQLLALFEEVLDVVEHGYTPSQLLYASQALAHLISVMIRRRREHWREAPDARQKVAQSIAYMKQHLETPLRVARLASLAALSSAHYSDLFKQQTGYSPIDYFIRLRMHRACQLLDTTQLSIKAIASLLGYDDQLYFSRVFRIVNDLAPSAYRGLRKG